MTVDELVAAGEALHEELGREYYLTGAGLKPDPAFEAIHARYGPLTSAEAVAVARSAGDPALLEWVMDIRVSRAVASLEERQLIWEREATVSLGLERVPYLRIPIEISNTPDRSRRMALDSARGALVAEELEALLRERFQREHALLAELGWGDYVEARSRLAGIDLDHLGRMARGFLEDTEDMYRDSLRRMVRRRLDLSSEGLTRSDAAWLFRAGQFDHAFAGSAILDTALAQMREMELDAAAGGRVRFDTEEREGKQPRAFCAPVRVPWEVYLVLRPRGGHGDFRTFWHELGHAMHFASVSPDLSFSARWLGDNSVTEGFAMLWDHLTLHPRWLVRYTSLTSEEIADLCFELGVSELYLARRYAAKLIYELQLHRSDFQDVGPEYVALLTEATGFRYPEADALLDVDPGFYAARYLRAWQLEAMLATHLTQQFDEDWFRNPAAGAAVQEWMSRGQAEPADRLAAAVTGQPLSFGPVAARVAAVLS